MSYQVEQKLRDDDTSDTKWAIAFFDLMQNYVVCDRSKEKCQSLNAIAVFLLVNISPSEFQTVQGKEPLKHLLIGSSKAVTSTIHYLQVIGYADVGDWSPLLPSPNPGEVMSILNRRIMVQ